MYLEKSNIFSTFEGWIGGICNPSDKGKLTAFPRFKICQHKFKKVSIMLRFEDLPKINSERWLSLENLEGEEWRDIDVAKGSFMISNYGRVKGLERERENHYSTKVWKERIRRIAFNVKGYPTISLTVNCKKVYVGSIHKLVAMAFIPNTDNKPQIDHINTIRTDNRVCNLRWVTNKENAYNPITHEKVHRVNSVVGVRHHTDETKNKIRRHQLTDGNYMKGRNGALHHLSIPVVQLTLKGEFVKEWSCAREASRIYGCHITDCCRGNRTQCGGHKWRYKKDYIE